MLEGRGRGKRMISTLEFNALSKGVGMVLEGGGEAWY